MHKINPNSLLSHLSVITIAIATFFIQGPSFVFNLWDHLYDAGDSFLNSWILAWDAHALFSEGISIWDAPIFYPVKNTLAFSENMFGNLWITIPIQYATNNHIFAANMLILTSYILCMYFVFLLIRDMTGSHSGGLVGGILFSFNPYRWGHTAHLQLLPFFWAPLALLFANRFMKEPKKKYFFGMLSFTLLQYYASIYLGMMLLTMLIVMFSVHIVNDKKGSERWIYVTDKNLRNMFVVGLALSVLALLPLALPYYNVAKKWHFVRSLDENAMYAAEPLSFFIPLSSNTYRWINNISAGRIRGGEGAVFFGLTPWILTLVGFIFIFRQRQHKSDMQRQAIIRFAWTALAMGILMLGPFLILFDDNTHIPMPYQLFYYLIPGFKAMRVPARFAQPLLLCLSVMAGFAAARLLESWKKWSQNRRISLLLVILTLFYLDYAVPDNSGVLVETQEGFPPIYLYLSKSNPDRPILEVPVGHPGFTDFRYLHYQTAHWRPILGGWSGWVPPGRLVLSEHTNGCPSLDCLRFISLTPAMTIVVHLDQYSEEDKKGWQSIDLTSYGFVFAGRIGDALVWERQRDLEPSSEKLAIVHPQLFTNNNKLHINILLRPAEADKSWHQPDKGWSEAKIYIETKQGKRLEFTKSFQVPPYVPQGEAATARIGKIKVLHEEIVRLQIEGPLIERYIGESNSFSTFAFDLKSTSRERNGGLHASLKGILDPPLVSNPVHPGELIKIQAD